jgi:hypothetical protein
VIKRIADMTEKMTVAGLAVGMFQDNSYGIVVGLFFLTICLYLTAVTGKEEGRK